MMTLQTLKIGKERLVVLREQDYKKLLAQSGTEHEIDAGDAAESRRRMKEPGSRSSNTSRCFTIAKGCTVR